jgi:ABC-type dipeptide/oligopeptide/nickel transport system permease component
MRNYILRRLLHSVGVLWGVTVVVFLILHLTGDPVTLLVPIDATQETVDLLRREMGLDDPLYVQYGRFIRGAIQGDFGFSYRQSEEALSLVLDRLPATLQLSFISLALALVVAVPVGIISAVKSNTLPDRVGMVFALLGQAIPVFWLGIMLILIFAVTFPLFPAAGKGTLRHLVLPSITLSMFLMARITRVVRTSMLEVLEQDYVRTARAKGLRELVVIGKHTLKNAAIPIITIVGLELGTLLGGAVITETVFAWPGVGRLAVKAIYNRDFPVVQASVFMLSLIFIALNFLVDILYTYIDPRVKFD